MKENKKFTASCDCCGGNTKFEFNPKDVFYTPDGDVYSVNGPPVDEMMQHHFLEGGNEGSGKETDSHNFFTVTRKGEKKGRFNVNTAGVNTYVPKKHCL